MTDGKAQNEQNGLGVYEYREAKGREIIQKEAVKSEHHTVRLKNRRTHSK